MQTLSSMLQMVRRNRSCHCFATLFLWRRLSPVTQNMYTTHRAATADHVVINMLGSA
jgi:hypothetical protein